MLPEPGCTHAEVLALVSGFTAIAQPLIITTTPMLPEGDLNCEDTMLFPALRTRKAPVALAAPPNLALPTAPLQQEKENPHLAIVLAPARPLAATHTPGDKRKRGGDAQQVCHSLPSLRIIIIIQSSVRSGRITACQG